MFETLTERFSETLRKVAGKSTLTEDNIQETLREVRQVLLEADVALPVVKDFVDQVRTRALGQEVLKSLSPGQAFLRIVQRELEQAMGAANEGLDLSVQPPAVILMAGLQGSGKTTSAAKLARWLKREGQEGADGQRRRLPPGRDPSARDAGRRASMPVSYPVTKMSVRSTSRSEALQHGAYPVRRRADRRHGRAVGDRRSDDAGDPRAACGRSSRPRRCSSSMR
jgi:hypothetical protein